MKHRHALELRSMMHDAEKAIPKTRSQIAERERDLLATASVALWEANWKKFHSCLNRLTSSPSDCKAAWIALYKSAVYIMTGAWMMTRSSVVEH